MQLSIQDWREYRHGFDQDQIDDNQDTQDNQDTIDNQDTQDTQDTQNTQDIQDTQYNEDTHDNQEIQDNEDKKKRRNLKTRYFNTTLSTILDKIILKTQDSDITWTKFEDKLQKRQTKTRQKVQKYDLLLLILFTQLINSIDCKCTM